MHVTTKVFKISKDVILFMAPALADQNKRVVINLTEVSYIVYHDKYDNGYEAYLKNGSIVRFYSSLDELTMALSMVSEM